ncbi:ankyrin repeat domain-containing protein [Pirellulaceae bacterium SH501]
MTSERPIYIRHELVNLCTSIPSNEKFTELEKRLKKRLSPSERIAWARIQGASIPRGCCLIPSIKIDRQSDDYVATEQPEIYSMRFLALDDEPESGTLLYSLFRREQIDHQDWIKCGVKDGTFLLWSRNKGCFGILDIDEAIKQPTILKASIQDFLFHVVFDLCSCPYITALTESQANYFFDDTPSKYVRNYFHLACNGTENNFFCMYSLLLELPENKLDYIFQDHRGEINKQCTDFGDYPITIAAKTGRADALRLLVANGADMSLGRITPFAYAIENGDCRFLQTMFRLGYELNDSDEKLLFESRITEAQRRFILS